MILDTSALLVILQDEPERRAFNERIEAAPTRALSAATFVEASIVMEARHGAEGVRDLDQLIEKASMAVVPVDLEQARLARQAYARFGRGRHGAGLNYGDCFSYALARQRGEPLLFKGTDFSMTDLVSALAADG